MRKKKVQTPMTKEQLVKMLLKKDIEGADQEELLDILVDKPIAVDVEKQESSNLTFGEKVSDKLSAVAGSWPFIIGFCMFLVVWILLNVHFLKNPVDKYPFILLNLVLSCIAAIQAPIITMSQNREAKKDSMRNQNDYQTDLKSELILEDLHDKIESLVKNQNKIIKYIEELEENKK